MQNIANRDLIVRMSLLKIEDKKFDRKVRKALEIYIGSLHLSSFVTRRKPEKVRSKCCFKPLSWHET